MSTECVTRNHMFSRRMGNVHRVQCTHVQESKSNSFTGAKPWISTEENHRPFNEHSRKLVHSHDWTFIPFIVYNFIESNFLLQIDENLRKKFFKYYINRVIIFFVLVCRTLLIINYVTYHKEQILSEIKNTKFLHTINFTFFFSSYITHILIWKKKAMKCNKIIDKNINIFQ